MIKRIVIAGIICVAAIVGVILYNHYIGTRYNENESLKTFPYELIGSSTYDPSSLYQSWSVKPGSPFTWWDVFANQSNAEYVALKEDFVLPSNMAFDDYNYMVVYGRKLVALEYYIDAKTYGEEYGILVATFEEEHQGNEVFFYKTDKRMLVSPDVHSPCYVMNGEEKEYVGSKVSFFNEPDTEREGYVPGI